MTERIVRSVLVKLYGDIMMDGEDTYSSETKNMSFYRRDVEFFVLCEEEDCWDIETRWWRRRWRHCAGKVWVLFTVGRRRYL